MANEKRRKWTDLVTCRQILNLMVILGFMFNYMLRVNLTIAIVAMIRKNDTTTSAMTTPTQTDDRFDWTESEKNDVLGYFFFGYILTELPGGRLAELIGARRVFGGGMLLASLITLATPLACHLHLYWVLFTRILLGFFLGATWPAIVPMATKWIPPMERSKFIANMMASSLGAAITMPICGLLIAIYDWPSVFYVTGAVGVVWSIAWFGLVYDTPAQHPRITLEERTAIESAIGVSGGGGDVERVNGRLSKTHNRRVPWLDMLTSRPVWAIIITHACSVTCYFLVVNQLPSYMHHVLHFNIKKNGLLSSLPYLGKYLMAIIASYLADYLRRTGCLTTTITRKLFTTFALAVPALLMIIESFVGNDPTISVIVFTISLFFNGAVTAGYLSNGLDIAPNYSGTIFGMANTLSSLGGWLSTKLVAILTEDENTFDRWRYVFWIMVGLYGCGFIIYLIFGTGELQKWNDQQDVKKSQIIDKEMVALNKNETNEC